MGASGTKLLVGLAPSVLTLVPTAGYLGGWIPGGWRALPAAYAAVLVLMGVAVFLFAPTPDRTPGKGRSFADLMGPLRDPRVWRFSLYYVVVFGAYVALSAWLPTYYQGHLWRFAPHGRAADGDVYLPREPAPPRRRLALRPVRTAGRHVRGVRHDGPGPGALIITPGMYVGLSYEPGMAAFAALMFVVGAAMGIGKASVFKYVPDYYPNDVGAVGGLVGALGALGGFVLPPAFGAAGRLAAVPQAAFVILLTLTLGCLCWLQIVVLGIKARERDRRSREPAVLASPT